MSPTPQLSIVMPCLSLPHENLLRYSAALKAFPEVEFLCVLNGEKSDPNVPPGIRLIVEPVKGCARARNAGALAARGEYLFFIDDTSLVAEQSLKAMLEIIRKVRPEGLQCPIHHVPKNETIAHGTIFRHFYFTYKHQSRGTFIISEGKNPGIIDTAGVVLNREKFFSLGGFDERFLRFEDREFGKRWRKRFQISPLPEVRVTKIFDDSRLMPYLKKQLVDFQGRVLCDLIQEGAGETLLREWRSTRSTFSPKKLKMIATGTASPALIAFSTAVSLLKRLSFPYVFISSLFQRRHSSQAEKPLFHFSK